MSEPKTIPARDAPPASAGEASAPLISWLLDAALDTARPSEIVEGLALNLRRAGAPVDRLHASYSMLHPLFESESLTWIEGQGVEVEGHHYIEAGRNADWLASPIRHVIVNEIEEMRLAPADPDAQARFPMMAGLSEAGFTDYVVQARMFRNFTSYAVDRDPKSKRSGAIISYATHASEGFSQAQIELLRAVKQPLFTALKVANLDRVARELASCYIGREAGARVLDGSIHRGDGAAQRAVVVFMDLRGSSRLAATLPLERYISVLNGFFDAVAPAVHEGGGEIVAFLGDGALAIFPVDRLGEGRARAGALDAVRQSFANVARLNAERREDAPELRFGAALHAGEVNYGNIGAPERQTWSVIGAVVNEASRLQELTKELGEPLLASGAFVESAAAGWRPLGERRLRGLERPVKVFAPVDGRER